ncbi:MAG: molecular chaperone [Betaproteobacteria bacterium]|nr:MAG: molecular chaperone [Betaproteobacteria bacterium]
MTVRIEAPRPASQVSPEDGARADFYTLISRLFHAGPDAQLLAAIAGAGDITGEDETAPLAAAWRALRAAAAAMDAEAAREEYDHVFVGTGKAEITPYASHYLAESMQERVLVRLRVALAEMGLAKNQSAAEYEDHLSGLCEVMRHLIFFGSDDVAVRKQKSFFLEYLVPWYAAFCATVLASPNTDFYKHVARFVKAFLDVESSSFEMI